VNPAPEDLAKIVSESAEANQPPPQIPEETPPDLSLDLEEHKLAFQLECLEQELKELRETHGLRVSYTGRIFWLVVAWLTCVVVCVMFSGFRYHEFRLSDSVIIAFITSTTVNVVGLFVLVAKWMFPSGSDSPDRKAMHLRAESLRKATSKNAT
jgi:hypothetical protein